MSAYPPNWEDRPRVKRWNEQVTPEYLASCEKEDLISRIGLLNAQMTQARQDLLDAHNLDNWRRHQLVDSLGEAGRVYKRLLDGKRRGRKSMRLTELLDEVAS